MNTTAKQIIELLEIKHNTDVFVSECKTGPSQNAACPRMDGWAMRKSWANPAFIGYEVKISRADFMQDQKWRYYLKFCNEFYFVCPTGLIKKEELPADTGLIYLSKTGNKLFTKKKAPHRNLNVPVELFMYILMCRTSIVSPQYRFRDKDNSIERWREWLDKKDGDKLLGWNVSKKIQQLVKERIDDVRHENALLSNKIENLETAKRFCDESGISLADSWRFKQHVQERIDAIKGKGHISKIDEAIENLNQIKEMF